MSASLHHKIKFSEPGEYRLRISGRIHPEIWNFFEGQIDKETLAPGGQITTTLNLHVRDQSELLGFINMIHDRRLVLLSIRMA